MKIACLLITHLRAKAEMQRHPNLVNTPAIIVERSEGKARVVDATRCTMGVSQGMTLKEALSISPEALVLDADESHYNKVFSQILQSLQGISDRVEGPDLGVAYIRLDGLEHLYGGEARLVNALLNAVPQDLTPRVGVAEAKFPAFIAATVSEPSRAIRVPPDGASFLAPHPVDLLPISADLKVALHRFGLHTLGDVAHMTEASMTDRFRSEGRKAWNLSNGIDDSPVVPLGHTETIVERTSLPFSSASLDLLITMVDTLLARAFTQPAMRGRYAGRAVIQCALEDGPTWSREFSFKGGVGSGERALSILRPRLEEEHPQGAVEDVTLTLDNLTGESGVQMGLLPDVRESGRRQLVEVERGLRVRTGGRPALYRIVEAVPRHPAPEMRTLRVPIDSSESAELKPVSGPVAVVVEEDRERKPVSVRVGNRWRRVACIEEEWGFDLWWMSRPMTRSYYRVRGEDGVEVTLFRDERGGCWYRQSA